MNNNYEVVATATKGLELTNVDKVKLNEALTLTDNNDIKAICTSVAKVLSMSNIMDYTLCKAYASIRMALKDEKNLSFKKWCEINDKDISNTNKYATVWDKFYSDIPDKNGVSPRSLFEEKNINILEYTPSFLSTFNSRTTVDVALLFVNACVTPNATCKQARELNKCFESSTTQGTIVNIEKAINIMNGVSTKDEKKSDEKKSDEKKSDEKKSDEKKSDEKKSDEKKSDEKKNNNTKHMKMSKDMISFIDKVCNGLDKEVETSAIVISLKDGTTVIFEK